MTNRTLTDGQESLLCDLYKETIIKRKTPGMFRDDYKRGCKEKKWSVEDTLNLEKDGLIKLSQELVLAGIMCPILTGAGLRYTEVLAAA